MRSVELSPRHSRFLNLTKLLSQNANRNTKQQAKTSQPTTVPTVRMSLVSRNKKSPFFSELERKLAVHLKEEATFNKRQIQAKQFATENAELLQEIEAFNQNVSLIARLEEGEQGAVQEAYQMVKENSAEEERTTREMTELKHGIDPYSSDIKEVVNAHYSKKGQRPKPRQPRSSSYGRRMIKDLSKLPRWSAQDLKNAE